MSKEKCQGCKWWALQGSRTKAMGFTPTVVGWCKRMPHTERDKDKDDYCGEFTPHKTTLKTSLFLGQAQTGNIGSLQG